jgi:hypothetical protein
MTDLRILSLYWRANWRYPRLAAGVLATLIVGVGVDFAVPLLVAGALRVKMRELPGSDAQRQRPPGMTQAGEHRAPRRGRLLALQAPRAEAQQLEDLGGADERVRGDAAVGQVERRADDPVHLGEHRGAGQRVAAVERLEVPQRAGVGKRGEADDDRGRRDHGGGSSA